MQHRYVELNVKKANHAPRAKKGPAQEFVSYLSLTIEKKKKIKTLFWNHKGQSIYILCVVSIVTLLANSANSAPWVRTDHAPGCGYLP